MNLERLEFVDDTVGDGLDSFNAIILCADEYCVRGSICQATAGFRNTETYFVRHLFVCSFSFPFIAATSLARFFFLFFQFYFFFLVTASQLCLVCYIGHLLMRLQTANYI